MSSPSESAVVILVPEAESVVGEYRRRFDRAAAWGVPAHVTVLYPFVDPQSIDESTLTSLRTIFGGIQSFRTRWSTTGWFNEDVLWLAPEPEGALRAITQRVREAFPGYLPYGGDHDDVVPHLTVAHDAPLASMLSAELAIVPQLPITATITAAQLMIGTSQPDSWRVVAELPLAPLGRS